MALTEDAINIVWIYFYKCAFSAISPVETVLVVFLVYHVAFVVYLQPQCPKSGQPKSKRDNLFILFDILFNMFSALPH